MASSNQPDSARTLTSPDPQAQANLIKQLLDAIEKEPGEPDVFLVEETEHAIDNLKSCISDAEQFVAGSFQAFLPAWKALLSQVKRASLI
jgi:hypothetical protein